MGCNIFGFHLNQNDRFSSTTEAQQHNSCYNEVKLKMKLSLKIAYA